MSAAGIVLGLGLSGAALGLILARRSMKSPAAKADESLAPTGHREPITAAVWTPQTPQEVQDLLRTACGCLDAATRLDDEDLVLCVWRAHWPAVDYPERAVDGDHPSVLEALEAVRASIVAAHDGQCQQLPDVELDDGESSPPTPDTPAVPPNTPPAPILGTTATGPRIEPLVVRTPIDMAALTRAAVTPGYFYQVRQSDRFLGDEGIIARALYQAVRHAAKAKGWTDTRAVAHAAALAADVKARVTYLSIVQCSPWNDAMYGTWGYGPDDLPAAHGRAIRLIARHDRVYDRLAEGQAPIRTLDRGSPANKGSGSATGAGDMLELLWLPPLRSDALLDASRSRQVVAEGLVWPDNSSKYNPPPSVQALGIANAPAGPWGCKEVAA